MYRSTIDAMEPKLYQNINMDFCRLCQSNVGLIPLRENKELTHKIYSVTTIKINVNNINKLQLPTQICLPCQERISNTYDYVQKVKRNDVFFKTAVQKLEHNKFNLETKTTIADSIETKDRYFKGNYLSCLNDNLKPSIKFENELNLFCTKCSALFKKKEKLKNHICTKPKNSNEPCANALIKNNKAIKQRGVNVNSNTTLKTKIHILKSNLCKETLSSKDDLQLHIKNHTKFACQQENCSKILASVYSLKMHKLIHEGKKQFLCVTCGKPFTTKHSLNCHEKIHLNDKGYKCEPCNIGFSVGSNLRAHRKKYHEGVRFHCSKCTKQFLNKCSLQRHEKIHFGIKEFKCDKCPSQFYTNKELLKHQRYHQGIRLYKCKECFKTFYESHHLTIHLRIHSGERPYVCKIPGCDRSFTESQKLKKKHNLHKHSL